MSRRDNTPGGISPVKSAVEERPVWPIPGDRVNIVRLPSREGPREQHQAFGLGVRTIKEIPVAAKCDVCAKGPGFGHNVPWSKKKTNRRWNPNIQRVRAVVGGTAQRLNVCTSCLKAGKVNR